MTTMIWFMTDLVKFQIVSGHGSRSNIGSNQYWTLMMMMMMWWVLQL